MSLQIYEDGDYFVDIWLDQYLLNRMVINVSGIKQVYQFRIADHSKV